ncbi:MAG: hypothetical protein DRI57_30630 [Deltaproteobacteria bacterium]|nr:MAG: hypothetical protein DRI57_30630 [Deltaproteobacteria bacterium]
MTKHCGRGCKPRPAEHLGRMEDEQIIRIAVLEGRLSRNWHGGAICPSAGSGAEVQRTSLPAPEPAGP